MKLALTILEIWAGLLFVPGSIYLALLHTKRIQFHEIDPIERREFARMVKGSRK